MFKCQRIPLLPSQHPDDIPKAERQENRRNDRNLQRGLCEGFISVHATLQPENKRKLSEARK